MDVNVRGRTKKGRRCIMSHLVPTASLVLAGLTELSEVEIPSWKHTRNLSS